MNNEELTEGGVVDSEMLNVPMAQNRSAKRKMLKVFKKDLAEHEKRRPKVNIDEDNVESQEAGIAKVRAWGSKYMYLIRKIDEYES